MSPSLRGILGPSMPAQAPVIPPAVSLDRTPADGGPTGEADELVLMHTVRLLNQVVASGPLSLVERAFVSGARVMFEQLMRACDELLAREPRSLQVPLANPETPPVATSSAEPERTSRRGASRTPARESRTP